MAKAKTVTQLKKAKDNLSQALLKLKIAQNEFEKSRFGGSAEDLQELMDIIAEMINDTVDAIGD